MSAASRRPRIGNVMRFIPIILTLLLAGSIAGLASWSRHRARLLDERVAEARHALNALQREVRVRAAMEEADLNGRGWPRTIDPAWFGDEPPPSNPFVPNDRAWLEIASQIETDLEHPPIRQSVKRGVAAFWYNPANGVVRARVGPSVSDKRALDLYNRINGSSVASLFDPAWDAERLLREHAELLKQQRAREKDPDPVIVVRRRPEPVADADDQER